MVVVSNSTVVVADVVYNDTDDVGRDVHCIDVGGGGGGVLLAPEVVSARVVVDIFVDREELVDVLVLGDDMVVVE